MHTIYYQAIEQGQGVNVGGPEWQVFPVSFTNGSHCVALVTNTVIRHELRQNEHICGQFYTDIYNG